MMITKIQLRRMVAEELIYELHGQLPNMTAEESESAWTVQRQEVRETLAMYDEGPQDDESAQAAISILQDAGILPPGLYRGTGGIETLRADLEESEKIGAASVMSEAVRPGVGSKVPDDAWDAIDRVAYKQERDALVDMANEFEAGGQTDLVDIKHKIETLRRVNEVRGSSYGSYPLQTVVAAIVGALNELPKLVPDRSKWLPGYTGDVQKWAKKRDPSGANARNLKRDLVQAWRHLPDNQEPRSVVGRLR